MRQCPDTIHAHDFDTLPLAMVCARMARIPLINDVHEVYAYMIEGDVPRFVSRLLLKAERVLVRGVDYFIMVNEPVAEVIIPNDREYTIVMNSIEIPESAVCGHSREGMVVFYGGEIGKATLIPQAIEAIVVNSLVLFFNSLPLGERVNIWLLK